MAQENDNARRMKKIAKIKLDPFNTLMPRYAQSKRMTKQAQSMAMDKVKKKRSTAADSKRKTGQAIKVLSKKKAAPTTPARKGAARGKAKRRGM